MDLKDIKAIIDLMKKNSVSEFELEKQEFKIRLKRGVTGTAPVGQYEETQPVTYVSASAALPAPAGSGIVAVAPERAG